MCALSGIKAQSEEFMEMDDDPYPEGWIELKFTRRYISPKWEAIQYVKQGLVAQYVQNIPEEQREEQLMALSIQVDAQFAALEDMTDKWEEDSQTLHIANPDNNDALMAEYNKLRKSLGLKAEVKLIEEPVEDAKEVKEGTVDAPV